MGEGSAAIQRKGRAASGGGWGSLITTIQVYLIFKTGRGKFAIHKGLLFEKHL
jgi:hypothetical protein